MLTQTLHKIYSFSTYVINTHTQARATWVHGRERESYLSLNGHVNVYTRKTWARVTVGDNVNETNLEILKCPLLHYPSANNQPINQVYHTQCDQIGRFIGL